MKTAQELYTERLNRIMAAVRLEKPDRVPVLPLGDSFLANIVGVNLSDFCTKPEVALDTMIKGFEMLGNADGIQHASFNVGLLSYLWLSKVDRPGIELTEEKLWQVRELELMTREDYDVIINGGFNKFIEDFYLNKLDNLMSRLGPFFQSLPEAMKAWGEHGVVPFSPVVVTIPYENFCGGRSMTAFFKDLYKIPDKVQEAMDAAMPDILESARQAARGLKPVGMWVGGWRAASEFLSPKLWQRFVLPYYKQLVQAVIDEGVVPVLHFDSNWTRDLELFREFPKAKCVLSLDGATDIYKAKELLGNHMCIMGDVPPALLTLGTPDEVYDYSQKLIRDIGPTGFILAQGCDTPPDAKLENVRAMVAAAAGK